MCNIYASNQNISAANTFLWQRIIYKFVDSKTFRCLTFYRIQFPNPNPPTQRI